jgi:hypothetical protein
MFTLQYLILEVINDCTSLSNNFLTFLFDIWQSDNFECFKYIKINKLWQVKSIFVKHFEEWDTIDGTRSIWVGVMQQYSLLEQTKEKSK